MNEPIISPWLFYFIGNLENFREFFVNLTVLFFFLIVGYLSVCLFRSMDKGELVFNKWVFSLLLFITILLNGVKSAIPDKETAYTMLVASMVTPHNIQVAGEAADNVITYTGDKADAFATRLSEIITDSAVKVIEKVKE